MISVLYVDDESSLLDIGRRFLEKSGDLMVDTAESADIALNKITRVSYDAVVSDYQMPGMDGIAFLSVLRKDHPHLPFIIFTGRGREEVVIEAFEKGADFYLQKGGEPKAEFAELAHKVRVAVQLKRDRKALRESEQRFRQMFDRSRAVMMIVDPENGAILDVNPAAVTFYGYPRERLLSMRVEEIHLEPAGEVTAARWSAAHMDENFFVFRHRLGNGSARTVEVFSSPFEAEGRLYLFSIVHDITGRKRPEDALSPLT